MTPAPSTLSPQIERAALWLVSTPKEKRKRAAVPALRERFQLSALEAVEAIRRAAGIRTQERQP